MYVFSFPKNNIVFGTNQEIISQIDKIITTSIKPSQVITLNLLIYLQSKVDFYTGQALKHAQLITCDSFFISLVCSLVTLKILKSLAGVELVEDLLELASKKEYKVFLFGAKEEVVLLTAEKFKKRYNVNIVGVHHGFVFHPVDLTSEVIKKINLVNPDILLVGLPTEIQERWIYCNIDKLNCKVVIGLGGSFDVISGKIKRAPKFFRIIGLEWFYRLCLQPWRILRIIKLPIAAVMFIYDCIKGKFKLYL